MEKRFLDFIAEHNLLKDCDKLLLGVSGGPDSLTMLHLFNKLKEKLGLEIAAAHLDHQFRKESAAEADFTADFAADLGVEFYAKTVNLPRLIRLKKKSPEAEARYQRFKFFQEIITVADCDRLALAHHSDDQAETVLLNLFRGSGLNGLAGIEPQSKYQDLIIIHPLLLFKKSEIKAYSRQNELKARLDPSNQKNIYSRNIIRNKILPLVENEINENAKEVIARNSKLISSENKFLAELAIKNYQQLLISAADKKIIIDFAGLKKRDRVLQRRIYRHIYRELNNGLDDLYLEHILEIEKLTADSQTGRGVDIAAGIRVEISYDQLVFFQKEPSAVNNRGKKRLNLTAQTEFGENILIESSIQKRKDFSFNNDPKRAAFDYHKIKFPLYIRSRSDGDKFIPLGMKGHKKLKDILIDQKVPRAKRKKAAVVTDAEDNIIWLAPYKMADDFKISEKTEEVLVLELKTLGG